MEFWDVLDSDGNFTGRTTVRGKNCLKPSEYHAVVHIWILSSDKRWLIQKRAFSKPFMRGEWAATGGAVISGEKPISSAKRELFEELGIPTNPDELKFYKRLKRKSAFVDVFFVKTDIKISELKLQRSEVANAKWVTLEELKNMIDDGSYHNYGEEYFTEIFGASERFLNGEL